MMIWKLGIAVAITALGAGIVAPRDAHACGGCFIPPSQTTVVTGHRMAMSISTTQSILWDQIEYSGDPSEFSWVLPIKPGARLELSTDAFFEALDAATSVTVAQPPSSCPPRSSGGSIGCGSSFADSLAGASNEQSSPPVTVIHEGTVGPYETVTLSTTVPGALNAWLQQHGYAVPAGFQPVIDAYVAGGFDFIALKLLPNAGVSQMKPVRVVSPGSNFTLPLRMVAAGTGARVPITLFVIAEGRYQASNFPNAVIPSGLVTWDWDTRSSDYGDVRKAALGNDGTWLTPYALRTALLSPIDDPIGFSTLTYAVGSSVNAASASTIAEAYVRQGLQNGETTSSTCLDALGLAADSSAVVVDLCDTNGNCTTPGVGQIGAESLACGALDDFAAALTGMHPSSVWLTRLEADLPQSLLATDLTLGAAPTQESVWHRFRAGLSIDEHCDAVAVPPARFGDLDDLPPGILVVVGVGAAGLALFLRRRNLHPSPA